MKNLYPKSKGKIHPSPAPATASGDALSVLTLLPAAILAVTAALAFEDKEVVAYLMVQSMKASAADERRRCRSAGGVRRPLFDCGCFECYTSFWSRWDCSKDREAIHQVIEAFEEHLASEEKGKERRRRKKRRAKAEEGRAGAEAEADGEKFVDVIAAAEESKGFMEEEEVSVSDGCVAEYVGSAAVSGGERRRGWADVVGMFNSRLWNLWGPGV